MTINSPETIASVLVSFSTIGFVVLFGTATFVPMIYELTILTWISAHLVTMNLN